MPPSPRTRSFARRVLRTLGGLAIFGVVAIAALFLSLWLEHRTPIALPQPSGPFAVGREIEDWTADGTSPDTFDAFAPAKVTKRELLVWLWYPGTPGPATDALDYMPVSLRSGIQEHAGVLLSRFLTRDLSKVRPQARRAAISPDQPSYPLVILRAGASLEVADYSSLAEDLASHGYVVVGFDAPYRTGITGFPDGRIIPQVPENNPEHCLESNGEARETCAARLLSAWAADMAFVLDGLQRLNSSSDSPWKGRLDLGRVGVFGHSFGGAAAAWFCHQDSRCKAGIDVDGAPHGEVIRFGIDRPFMILLSDHSRESDTEGNQIRADIQSLYDHLPRESRIEVTIRGANHFTFTDDGALLKSRVLRWMLRRFGVLRIDGPRQLAITSYCLYTFFDAYLKESNPSRPQLPSSLYPELEVQQ